jgi:hypothetical protein
MKVQLLVGMDLHLASMYGMVTFLRSLRRSSVQFLVAVDSAAIDVSSSNVNLTDKYSLPQIF